VATLLGAQKALESGRAMHPGEVALLLRFNPKTVSRWCKDRKVPAFQTPGGHWRIPAQVVRDMLNGKIEWNREEIDQWANQPWLRGKP